MAKEDAARVRGGWERSRNVLLIVAVVIVTIFGVGRPSKGAGRGIVAAGVP